MPPSLALRFCSPRFDHTSELPEHYNAGNRFYGRDLAEWLAGEFTARGLPAGFLDEDWGWLVHAERGTPRDFEVAIYLLDPEDMPLPHAHAGWGLWIRAHETRRLLGLLPKRREVPVPPEVERAVRDALAAIGAACEPWADSPGTDEPELTL